MILFKIIITINIIGCFSYVFYSPDNTNYFVLISTLTSTETIQTVTEVQINSKLSS